MKMEKAFREIGRIIKFYVVSLYIVIKINTRDFLNLEKGLISKVFINMPTESHIWGVGNMILNKDLEH